MEVSIKVCEIMMEKKDISEIAINPLIDDTNRVTAVDGLAIFN